VDNVFDTARNTHEIGAGIVEDRGSSAGKNIGDFMTDRVISQISLVAEMVGLLEKKFGCKAMNAREMNTVIQAADLIVEEFAKPDVPVTKSMGLLAWLASDRVGLSSKYMAHVMSGGTLGARYAHPHDPADFGRCLGLLDAVPEFRSKLSMMALESREWEGLVQEWDVLESLYREEYPTGYAPKCFEKMRSVLEK